MEPSESEVQLDNSDVAIYGRDRVDAAVTDLEASGNEVRRLSGPGDADKLAPNQEGVKGALSKWRPHSVISCGSSRRSNVP